MPYFSEDVEVFVDVRDFINECSDSEIIKLVKILEERGIISDPSPHEMCGFKSSHFLDDIWDEDVNKILLNKHSLTNEEELFIKKIANRL